MKLFLKYLGIIIVLLGVCILAIPFFMGILSNQWLVVGGSFVVLGFLAYVLINKYI
ncbi:hypothetical protein LJB98_02230 [Bacteroidales bacterium OttesenSCG-928-M11]|nr:hypothetical protein [Bacteroidales bacterium OttesenSCG-928-M11]